MDFSKSYKTDKVLRDFKNSGKERERK